MGIFKKKTKNETVITSAPDTPETAGEVNYMEQIQNTQVQQPQLQPVVQQVTPVEQPVQQIRQPVVEEKEEVSEPQQLPQVREIPRCMSQTQINNLIIDIDLKLNYIISKIEEE